MKPFSPRLQGLIAINLAAMVFGSAALFGKLDVSVVWIVAARSGFAAIALLVVALIQRQSLSFHAINRTMFGTSILLAVHWLAFFASVQLAGVAIATLTFASFPFFTVVMEAISDKRRLHPLEILAALMIVAAVALIVDTNFEDSPTLLVGTAMGLLSAITFAVFGVTSKKLNKTLSPVQISFLQNLVVTFILAPFLHTATPMPATMQDWLWLALLGMVTTALMHQLYFYALRRLSAAACSGFVALEPVYAILFAALIFSDPVTIWVVLSAALIVSASFILLRREKTPPLAS